MAGLTSPDLWPFSIVNTRSGMAVARAIELADTRETRNRGLLGRAGLAAGTALVIVPCCSIHTAFMRFPIDALFVDREGVVVRIARRLGPWRIAASLRSRMVVELPSGAADAADVRNGDVLYLSASDDPAGARGTWSFASIRSLRSVATKPSAVLASS